MRVLSVATALPYPPDHATRVRSWNLLRGVAAWAEVTLLTWDTELHGPHADAVRGVVHRLVLAPLGPASMGMPRRAGRWLRALGGDLPPWVQALRAERGYARAAPEILEAHRAAPFDVVVAEEDAAAFLLPPVDVPAVVHRHNVFSRTLTDLRRGPARLLWPLERGVWRRFDTGSRFARLHVASTEESADALRDVLPRTRVAVVPNGVELPAESVRCGRGRDVAVIGTMDYAPNAEGVEWFVRQVWPRVRAEHPDAALFVIGRGADRLSHLAVDGVRVLGFVPDLRQACATVRAGAVPLRAGLGIKTKTLDFMGMGIPVVATPAGAEGIGVGPIVAANAAAFAAELSALLRDPARAERIGRAGRTAVAARFSWDAAAATYRSLLEEVAETRKAVTR